MRLARIQQAGLAALTVVWIGCGGGTSSEPPAPVKPVPLPEFQVNAQLPYLVSFVRLTAQIRFHHPGDAVAQTQWDDLMLEAAYRISSSTHSQAVEQQIWQLLSPLSGDIQLNGQGSSAATLPADATIRTWRQNAYTEQNDEDTYRLRVDLPLRELPNHPELSQRQLWRYDDALLHAQFPSYVATNAPAGTPYLTSSQYLLPRDLTHSAVCVATVAKVWSVIDQFFPDVEHDKAAWQQQLSPLLQSCGHSDRRLMYRQLFIALQTLNDGHIAARGPAVQAWQGEAVTPVRFYQLEGKVVAAVIKAGTETPIQLGDELLQVNDVAVANVVDELLPFVAASSRTRRDIAIQRQLLRAAAGSEFRLHLKDRSGTVYQTLLRASEDASFAQVAETSFFAPASQPLRWLSGELLYIDLARLPSAQYTEAITNARKAKGVVVDARGYPRDFNVFEQLLPLFCRQSPMIAYPQYFVYGNADAPTERFRQAVASDLAPFAEPLQVPVVGLQSRISLSANEQIISYLKQCRVPFIGETTIGANGVAARINLFSEYPKASSSIAFTSTLVTQPNGERFLGVGITPDMPVAPTIAGTRAQLDEQLAAAESYLRRK